jgi:endonuclease YncB( thermonuclease family)
MSVEDLNNIADCKLIKEFSLKDIKTMAKVIDVYDGDTVKAIFPYDNKMYLWNCRLNGIDTPEIRSSIKVDKERAIIARDQLRSFLLDSIVYIKCNLFDKYGRILTDIFIYNDKSNEYDINISDEMIRLGLAIKYDGHGPKNVTSQ